MKAVKLNKLYQCRQYQSEAGLWFYAIGSLLSFGVLFEGVRLLSANQLTGSAVGMVLIWCLVLFWIRHNLVEFWRRNVIGYKLLVIMSSDKTELDPLQEDRMDMVKEIDYVVSTTGKIPKGLLGYRMDAFGEPFIGLHLSLRSLFGKYPWTPMQRKGGTALDGVPTAVRFNNHSLTSIDVRNTEGNQLNGLGFKTGYQLAVDGFGMARWKMCRFNAYHLNFYKYHNAHFSLARDVVEAVKKIASSSRFCKSNEAKEVRQDLYKALKNGLPEGHSLLVAIETLQETEAAKVN